MRHAEAGEHLGSLCALTPICEANDIKPVAYRTDIILRVLQYLDSRVNEVPPHGSPP